MAKKIIVANWKMKLSLEESLRLASEIDLGLVNGKNKVIICPDFLSLPLIGVSIGVSNFYLGAQNSSSEEKAAATGEVSAFNLKELGVDYVILGHSERRLKQHENEKILKLKIETSLRAGLKVIFCVGEKLSEREAGKEKKFIIKQLRDSLKSLVLKRNNDLIIAYEPIWAIGSGKTIDSSEANKMSGIIKTEVEKILGKKVEVLYGGSVDSKNAPDFLNQKNISGLLVGGASLKAEEFLSICK